MFSKNFIIIRMQINKIEVAGPLEHSRCFRAQLVLTQPVLWSTVGAREYSECSRALHEHRVHTVHFYMSYHMYDLNININLYIISIIYKYIIDIGYILDIQVLTRT